MLARRQIQRRLSTEKPIDRPSGDQNMPSTPSDPGTAWSSRLSRDRTHSRPRLAYATERPSSESVGPRKESASRSGAVMAIRRDGVRVRFASVLHHMVAKASAPSAQAPATIQGQPRRRPRTGDGAPAATSTRGGDGIRPPSSSRMTRASPISRRRLRGSLRRQRASNSRSGPGVVAGRSPQSGSACKTATSVSGIVFAAKARRAVKHSKSTHPKDQMSVRRSTGFPRACSGLM